MSTPITLRWPVLAHDLTEDPRHTDPLPMAVDAPTYEDAVARCAEVENDPDSTLYGYGLIVGPWGTRTN